MLTFKYGVQVPASVAMARKLHIDNGKNTAWIDALKSEMKELFNLECFDIKSFGFTPGDDYQRTMLTIIYDVKQDLRQKPRLAAVGHLVDPLDHSVYSSTAKGISVKLLHLISHFRNWSPDKKTGDCELCQLPHKMSDPEMFCNFDRRHDKWLGVMIRIKRSDRKVK